MNLDSVVQAIQNSVTPHEINVNGLSYVSREVVLPPPEPTQNAIKIQTLTGLIDLINRDFADFADDPADFFIQVVSPKTVQILSDPSGRYKQRDSWAIASCEDVLGQPFRYGQFMEQDKMVIALQSQFDPSPELDRVLRYIGNVEISSSITSEDDGVSQSTNVKKAMGRVGREKFENPVLLAPYRTFHEIQQPTSPFVLRLQEGSRGAEFALFESGGGRWKLDAIQAIKEWLSVQQKVLTVVA